MEWHYIYGIGRKGMAWQWSRTRSLSLAMSKATSTILNGSYHLIGDLFDLKADFLRNGEPELNVS
jgi:hypothetical protein